MRNRHIHNPYDIMRSFHVLLVRTYEDVHTNLLPQFASDYLCRSVYVILGRKLNKSSKWCPSCNNVVCCRTSVCYNFPQNLRHSRYNIALIENVLLLILRNSYFTIHNHRSVCLHLRTSHNRFHEFKMLK